jgi:hypothetical protein
MQVPAIAADTRSFFMIVSSTIISAVPCFGSVAPDTGAIGQTVVDDIPAFGPHRDFFR